MILPFHLTDSLTAATPVVYCLTLDGDNPTYDATPGVPEAPALLTGAVVGSDSGGLIVEFGVSDDDGTNFTPVIPLILGEELDYPEGRMRAELSETRRPALRVTSKTSQDVQVVGHVELSVTL